MRFSLWSVFVIVTLLAVSIALMRSGFDGPRRIPGPSTLLGVGLLCCSVPAWLGYTFDRRRGAALGMVVGILGIAQMTLLVCCFLATADDQWFPSMSDVDGGISPQHSFIEEAAWVGTLILSFPLVWAGVTLGATFDLMTPFIFASIPLNGILWTLVLVTMFRAFFVVHRDDRSPPN